MSTTWASGGTCGWRAEQGTNQGTRSGLVGGLAWQGGAPAVVPCKAWVLHNANLRN